MPEESTSTSPGAAPKTTDMHGIIPVPQEEVDAWLVDLKERAVVKAGPAPSPGWYAKIANLVERLWIQNRDQATVIKGGLESEAMARKALKQERLF